MKSTPIKMILSQDQIQFTPNEVICGISKCLTISRRDLSITSLEISSKDGVSVIPIFGLIGILKNYGRDYLFYITQAKEISIFNRKTIYKIQQVQGILLDQKQQTSQEQESIVQIQKYLSKCMYFSYKYDLTVPVQLQEQNQIERSLRYWWNFNAMKPLLDKQLPQEWNLKIIQGYVGHSESILNFQPMSYTLISRREWMRGGTRYNHRGVEKNGSTSNFVETEAIITSGDRIYSHLQVRGSVPIYWQQNGIRALSELTENEAITQGAFNKHMSLLNRYYGFVLCVNLMSKDKPNEEILSRIYEKCCMGQQQVEYQFIDFHNVCKNYKFENLNQYIQYHSDKLKDFGFTKLNPKITDQQQGIVRTNCLDCLDRTNVFMTKIHFKVLQNIFKDIGVDLKKEFGCEQLINLAEQSQRHELIKMIKGHWGDSGDCISKVYAGTGATTTKMSKHGGNGWTGMVQHSLKGIERFYRQNFEDNSKQDIYNLVVGNHQQLDQIVNNLEQQISSKKSQLTFFVVSLDLKFLQSQDIFFPSLFETKHSPDAIIVSIKNVTTMLIPFSFIKEIINDSIKLKIGNYEFVTWGKTEFLYQLIFGKSKFTDDIDKTSNEMIIFEDKTIGLISTICCKEISITSITLDCPSEQVPKLQLQKVLLIIKQKLQQFDLVFICGLSTQIYQDNITQFFQQVPDDALSKLYQKDSLCRLLQSEQFFNENFQEPVIDFMPTENQWPQRILYGSSINIDMIRPELYSEIKFKKAIAIKGYFVIDLKLLEETRTYLEETSKQKSIEEEDEKETMFSSVFYANPLYHKKSLTEEFEIIP